MADKRAHYRDEMDRTGDWVFGQIYVWVFICVQLLRRCSKNHIQLHCERRPTTIVLPEYRPGSWVPPGMFYDRFGSQWSSGAGLVLSLASYLLLWGTTKSVSFYSSCSWLMAIYFFLRGLGSLFNYMVALNTNAINFHPKQREIIVSIISASFAGILSVFAALYLNIIGKKDPKSSDSFSTLMIMFAVCFVVLDILCIAFMRMYRRVEPTDNMISVFNTDSACEQPYDKSTESVKNSTEVIKTSKIFDVKNATATDLVDPNDKPDEDAMSVLTILTSLDYQLRTWFFTSASTAVIVCMITLTQTSTALCLDIQNAEIVLVIPITNAVISAAIVVISDHFQQKIPRVGILIMGIAAFVICQALVVGLGDKNPILVIYLPSGIYLAFTYFQCAFSVNMKVNWK